MNNIFQNIDSIRQQFPALGKMVHGKTAAYFDGPAGTQVPQAVIDAIGNYLCNHNANHEGVFATSVESDQVLHEAHLAAADFVGADDPDCLSFGPNMTTLTFALSRALARTWKPGDQIVLTRSEHDANFTPWVLAAKDAGVEVCYADISEPDCRLDVQQLKSLINDKTKLVAVGLASNASGTMHPVEQICSWAREVGALSFLDAVHFAPHRLIDVEKIGCDFLVCSAYKFFGPHVGIQYGRRELLEELVPYKLRPATDQLPGRWMTGTQNHECIAGTAAAIDYLAGLSRSNSESINRRAALEQTFSAFIEYEHGLLKRLMDGLAQNHEIKVWGIDDASAEADRLPTVSFTHDRLSSLQIAEHLAKDAIFVWHGNYYALPLTERLGLEPDGMVRVGIVHYNTQDEVERLLESLSRM